MEMTQTRVTPLTQELFDEAVGGSREPVLVDFYADWCGPCRAVAPTLEELARDYADRLTVAKVNVDEQPGLAARFNVRSIPTLLLFRKGAVVDRVVGALSKPALRRWLDGAA